MSKEEWVAHLDNWRTFLHRRLSDPDLDGGKQAMLMRQLSSIEGVRNAAVLNPSLLLEFIAPSPLPHDTPALNSSDDVLTRAQRAAVDLALSDRLLTLVQGPPGAGKTRVIARVCHELWKRDPQIRILVCSETHVAVDNLLERLALLRCEMRIVRVRGRERLDETGPFSPVTIVHSFLAWAEENIGDDAVMRILHDELAEAFRHDVAELAEEDEAITVDKTLEKALALSANVVGMTCNLVGKYWFRDSSEMFDLAIIDEACKATLPNLLAPLAVARRAMILGDPQQLPPVFCSADAEIIRAIDECDLMDHMHIDDLLSSPVHTVFLDEQYRMCNHIGNMISAVFYDGMLRNGSDRELEDSLVWLDYEPTQKWPPSDASPLDGAQIYNEDECAIIAKVLKRIGPGPSVAVITPYRAQSTRLRVISEGMESVTVGTVDSFQGKEADIVVFSVTRTVGPLRFLADKRRLNVALSRARDRIFIVGNLKHCEQNSRLNEIAHAWCRIERAEAYPNPREVTPIRKKH